ncbi:heme NO-binding domain-containing protein [Aestuariibacter sp. AA17]|uniref:Heme NO-binding domain-containing protein n=1 Tax=Fluctibacter corallii TaxID=2984329 RepID=A0ABT3A4D5_9ALTE|nr:heme NO-binding domain-containing protein [Aestuariibacter sp. AA17]MCV2883102.1 heme NO-binding domain-containing protein [Aestuariibacter sp. AA17]
MKGMILVELEKYIVSKWGRVVWQQSAEVANLPVTEDIHTGVIKDRVFYDIISSVVALRDDTPEDVLVGFGRKLFSTLHSLPASGNNSDTDLFSFILSVENTVYPNAQRIDSHLQLPHFVFLQQTSQKLVFRYTSPRHLCFLCEGILLGASDYFREAIEINHLQCVHEGDDDCQIEIVKLP